MCCGVLRCAACPVLASLWRVRCRSPTDSCLCFRWQVMPINGSMEAVSRRSIRTCLFFVVSASEAYPPAEAPFACPMQVSIQCLIDLVACLRPFHGSPLFGSIHYVAKGLSRARKKSLRASLASSWQSFPHSDPVVSADSCDQRRRRNALRSAPNSIAPTNRLCF